MSSVSRWPTAVDYQTALQVPTLCFQDEALKQGTITTDNLGLPLGATGNVVAVFRMDVAGQDTAIRCFTRRSTLETIEQRYSVAGDFISRYNIPALASCRYRPDEIAIGDERYAIVQMEWVSGLHLHRFIEQKLDQAGVLHALADQWRVLMAQLYTVHMAHGDLSDGNILVNARHQLRLVDYDAIYIPDLKDLPPDELGKPNYQHPDRMTSSSPHYGHYAPNGDAFAGLVIYLSLRAIAEDPGRWNTYNTGENLIFQQKDFKQPGETPIWKDLSRSTDVEVRILTGMLEEYCLSSVDELPTLEESLLQTAVHLPGRAQKPVQEETPKAEPPAPDASEKGETPRADKADTPRKHPEREPAPPVVLPPARVAWWRKPQMIAAIIVLLGLLAFGAVTLSGTLTDASTASTDAPARDMATVQTASATTSTLSPEELAGFYTGYATAPDGSREPMALTIETPFYPEGDAMPHFTYSINWKSFQSGGLGSYTVESGSINLMSHYELRIVSFDAQEIVLASVAQDGPDPLVQVKKKRLP